jgi:hypothetical protein
MRYGAVRWMFNTVYIVFDSMDGMKHSGPFHIQLRGSAVSCQVSLSSVDKRERATVILSTRDFTQTVDCVEALIACNIFAVAGGPVARMKRGLSVLIRFTHWLFASRLTSRRYDRSVSILNIIYTSSAFTFPHPYGILLPLCSMALWVPK